MKILFDKLKSYITRKPDKNYEKICNAIEKAICLEPDSNTKSIDEVVANLKRTNKGGNYEI